MLYLSNAPLKIEVDPTFWNLYVFQIETNGKGCITMSRWTYTNIDKEITGADPGFFKRGGPKIKTDRTLALVGRGCLRGMCPLGSGEKL